MVLRIGNFINHGVKDLDGGTAVRSFAIESLGAISSFRVGPGLSAMHLICMSMRRRDASFLQKLKDSLPHVHEAARDKSALLAGCVQLFQQEVDFAKGQLAQIPTAEI